MPDFIRGVGTVCKNETTDRCASMKRHYKYLSELNAFHNGHEE